MNKKETLTDLSSKLVYAESRVRELENELMTLKRKSATQTENTDVILSEIEVYAQEAIAKLVIELARLCDRLNNETYNRMAKEYVYLALGRTEIVKAEILDVLSQDIDDSTKKARIDNEISAAMDYYTSISNQIG